MKTHARILGIAQDAGVPHVGCGCLRCERRRNGPLRVACLGLVGASGRSYLIDATPDFPAQCAALPRFPTAILLTHAHIGHYTGLVYLGPEGLNAQGLAVQATPAFGTFLRENGPWRRLVEGGHIRLVEHPPGTRFGLEKGLEVESIPVEHRAEDSDTVAFRIHGPKRTVLYVPDIDAWPEDVGSLLDGCDELLLDGTFFDRGELKGRDQDSVAHPPIAETLDLLDADQRKRVRFVHLNHTNPALETGSAAWRTVRDAGARIGQEGEMIPL